MKIKGLTWYLISGLMLCLLVCNSASAQFSRERSALNQMEKGKWDRARSLLEKSIRKDSADAYARYVFAIYYFHIANPEYQIDSAYKYAMLALGDYELIGERDRERMQRIPLDSMVIVSLRERIDSAAFERAARINTEQSYISFLDKFPLAKQRDRAIELRNEVAYIDALKANTYQSFNNFLLKYPDSHRAHDAKERYDKLLFEAMTRDKKLSSYESFLRNYPGTPYRGEVERQIFEISTAAGTEEAFLNFIKEYPKSSMSRRASFILFYLLKESNNAIPSFLLNDSIKKVLILEKQFLFPFLENDKFGFMNAAGKEVIKPLAQEMMEDYLCGNITDDILILKHLVLSRNGRILHEGSFDEVDDLGNGFLAIIARECVKLIHKSGERIFNDCYDDVRALDRNYILVRKDNAWSIVTLTGRVLEAGKWSDVHREGETILLKRGNAYSLASISDLNSTADQNEFTIKYTCDEYRVWPGGLLWLRKGNQQALITSGLTEKIAYGIYELTEEFFGAMQRSSSGYRLYSRTFDDAGVYKKVRVSKPWVAQHTGAGWRLLDPVVKMHVDHVFDSIDFRGPFAIGVNTDTVRIFFNPLNSITVDFLSRIQFLPGKDSLFFLLVEDKDKKYIYDQHGQKLSTVTFDKVSYFGANLFQIQRRDKWGLLSSNGKVILPPEFDALGRLQDDLIPVLKDKKFGLIDASGRVEIKPVYEKNLVKYNKHLLIAFKDGYYGLISWNNKPATRFEFEEIKYWNDSVALVKKDFQWMLYNFVERKVVIEKIKDFKWVTNSQDEKILIIHQENNYGVVSSVRGEVIPTTFSEIINVGSPSNPVYFTEKHVEEASIYVVIYYNAGGELLKRQVFEIEDYEKIYCSGK